MMRRMRWPSWERRTRSCSAVAGPPATTPTGQALPRVCAAGCLMHRSAMWWWWVRAEPGWPSATRWARLGAGDITIVDIEQARADSLVDTLALKLGPARMATADIAALPETLADADGLVHATPTGMAAHPAAPCPDQALQLPALGRRHRLPPAGDRTGPRRACSRLPDAGRWRDGRVPGGGRVRAVHRRRAGRRPDARALRPR